MEASDSSAVVEYEWLKNTLRALYAQTLTPDVICTALVEAYRRGYSEGKKNGVS